MFDAMFIGLSGMNAYSSGLRQVSNNITNLNSLGYRASTIAFNDLFRGGSNGVSYASNFGSSGTGVQLSELRLDFAQGELRQTDRDLDLAVDGSGFLVLEQDGEYTYARTGSFEINSDGFIVLSGTQQKLTVLNAAGQAVSLSILPHQSNPPQATTRIQFANNLSSTATEYTISDLQVFNESGEVDSWQIKFERDDLSPVGEWEMIVNNSSGNEIGRETLRFNAGLIDPSTAAFTITDPDGDRTAELDFSENVTSFSSGQISTLRSSDIDGYGIGEITAVRLQDTGVLEIAYSNGQTHELGAVTIADFRDLQSLTQQSGGLFTKDSILDRELHSSESERVGRVLSRRLEASNVDLSKEFGDLILVQRGYQASSQIVSVSNDMIQQLFGIRGQG